MSRFKISIAADRAGEYSRKVAKETDAEIDTPSGDIVRGHFLGLSYGEILALPRMRNLRLRIEENSYRLLSLEDTGAFIAVKERED